MRTPLGEKLSDAIRFWEIRRIFYNLWLVAVVLTYFFVYWPASKSIVQLDELSWLFILAVLANVAYCAAYPVDVFVQVSGVREIRGRVRWVLFVVGMIFAGILTRWFSIGIFSSFSK
jgi:hypothetical protein